VEFRRCGKSYSHIAHHIVLQLGVLQQEKLHNGERVLIRFNDEEKKESRIRRKTS